MQEETEVLVENLRGQVWIENQIHIRLWPDWESNPGRIGERHGNNRCTVGQNEVKVCQNSILVTITFYLFFIFIKKGLLWRIYLENILLWNLF